MIKKYFIFLICILGYFVCVNSQIRYQDDLRGNIITTYQKYITYPLSSCWKNGNKPALNQLIKNDDPYLYNPSNLEILSPGSTVNNKCFNYFEMYSMKDQYNINDTTVDLNVKIYSLENDNITNKKAVIYLSGAQGFFDMPILGSGLRYWDKIYNNQIDEVTLKKQDEEICQYLAQKGFVVFAMDMRKGWDVKGISNMNATPELRTYWFHKYCDCEGDCDSYSVIEANYRNLQDLIAVYGYILSNKEVFNVASNGISLMGSSSGSQFAMMAGFALDNYPYLKTPTSNNSSNQITLLEKFGSPFKFFFHDSTAFKIDRIIALSCAISDTNWIELSDSVNFVDNKKFPVYIMQSTEDNVYFNCSGQMRNIRFKNVLDDKFFFYGGGNVHDRIMNLGNTESHLTTQLGMKHGGLFNYHEFHCYNPVISNKCFEAQDIYSEMRDKVATMLYYPIKKTNDYIHVVLAAHKQDEVVAGGICNLCDFRVLSKPDSLGQYYLSSCNYNIGDLFGIEYYLNTDITTDIPISFENEDKMRVFPNLFKQEIDIYWQGIEQNINVKIVIFDLMGKIVFQSSTQTNEVQKKIDLSTLGSGIYIITVFTENGILLGNEKIVKQ